MRRTARRNRRVSMKATITINAVRKPMATI
jgi:hypothetical protein